MKKALTFFAFVSLLASQAFATYIVVLKDGTRLKAKAKWTISNGKAVVALENGQTVQLNPAEIDAAKSEQVTKMGLGDVNIISLDDQAQPAQPPKQQQQSLGAAVRAMRPRVPLSPNPTTPTTASPVPKATAAAPVVDQLDPRVKDNFERAYENVGIFEHTLAGTNRTVRAELTADNEDKVFNAISATAVLISRNGFVDNMQIDMVELFMKTTTGGAAGRFQMSRADADAINTKVMRVQDYFVRKVIY